MIALDLFAGTGWGVACRELGIEEHGVELMPEARATRELNGMTTVYHDVWTGLLPKRVYVNGNQERAARRSEDLPAPTIHFGRALNDVKWQIESPSVPDYDLLIASPPCQTFSMAGGGAGRRALDDVLAAIDEHAYRDPATLRAFGEKHDPRTALVLTPLAHVYRDLPRYVVFEQVPPVLPVWERCAEEMRAWGYSVWTGNLQAEMYGTVVTCPLHSATAAADADRAFALDPATLAIADPAGTALGAWLEGAEIAAARETFIRKRASVESARRSKPGMTEGAVSERAAWNAALVSRAVLEDARDATWRELVKPLLSRALAETRTLPGRAGDMSMSAVTSGFESTALIAGSIESLPSRLWAALCDLAKSYITSTSRPTTTTPETSPSFVATPTIGNTIESVVGRASCGACNDHAVPQTRKRAILIAKRDPDLDGEAVPPVPTHSRYYSRDRKRLDAGVLPWVSMAEALGWGMTERSFTHAHTRRSKAFTDGGRPDRAVESPAPTVTGHDGHPRGGFEWVDHAGSAAERSARVMRSNYGTGGYASLRGERAADEPSAAITSRADGNQWHLDPNKPATTVAGDPRLTARKHHYHGEQNSTSTRVTVAEAAALQSYPPDFRWDGEVTKERFARVWDRHRDPSDPDDEGEYHFESRGIQTKPITKTKQFLQVGNAVPPLLAEAILRAVIS